jgi:hypothetical protein
MNVKPRSRCCVGWFNQLFRRRRRIRVTFGPSQPLYFNVEVDVTYVLPADRQVGLAIVEKDAAGNVLSETAGPFAWSVSDESVLKVVDHGDGTATLSPVGPLGAAQVNVIDTDDQLSGTLDVTVVAGAAASVTIIAGEAVPVVPAA